jgi:hypothetical protein
VPDYHLTDPNVDRLLGWDDSGSTAAFFVPGVGLVITGTALDVDLTGVDASGADFTGADLSAADVSGIDHGDLTDLLADDHTQYQLGAGIFDVTRFGAVSGDTGDQSSAIQDAIDAAEAAGGGVVFVPVGIFRCTSSLTIDSDDVVVRGLGQNISELHMVNAGVVLDGTASLVKNCGVERLRIRRDGGAGIAVHLNGAGAGTGPVHWVLRDLWISSASGTALQLQGTFIGWAYNVNLRSSSIGLNMIAETTTGAVGVNGVGFFGGEIQANTLGVYMEFCRGVSFYGTIIEGDSGGAVDINNQVQGVGLYGCYFESNGSYDVRLGDGDNLVLGVVIEGCYFDDLATTKDHAIHVVLARGFVITGNFFVNYGDRPVDIQGTSATAIKGSVRDNFDVTASSELVTVHTGDGRNVNASNAFLGGFGVPAAGATTYGTHVAPNQTVLADSVVGMPRAGFARRLRARVPSAIAAGESLTVTLYKGGIATALVCTIGAGNSTSSNLVNIIEFTEGEGYTVGFTASNNGSYATQRATANFEFVTE